MPQKIILQRLVSCLHLPSWRNFLFPHSFNERAVNWIKLMILHSMLLKNTLCVRSHLWHKANNLWFSLLSLDWSKFWRNEMARFVNFATSVFPRLVYHGTVYCMKSDFVSGKHEQCGNKATKRTIIYGWYSFKIVRQNSCSSSNFWL